MEEYKLPELIDLGRVNGKRFKLSAKGRARWKEWAEFFNDPSLTADDVGLAYAVNDGKYNRIFYHRNTNKILRLTINEIGADIYWKVDKNVKSDLWLTQEEADAYINVGIFKTDGDDIPVVAKISYPKIVEIR